MYASVFQKRNNAGCIHGKISRERLSRSRYAEAIENTLRIENVSLTDRPTNELTRWSRNHATKTRRCAVCHPRPL